MWQYLCVHAVWRDCEVNFDGRRVALRRGQIATTERFLATGFVVSRKVIRRLLAHMESAGMITITRARGGKGEGTERAHSGASLGAHGGTIITICNYDAFQPYQDEEGPQLRVIEGPRRAHEGPTEGPNKKEDKEVKEEESPPIVPQDGGRDGQLTVDQEFHEIFWPAYPHKVGKSGRGGAEGAWRSARKKASLETIMDGLRRYIANKPPDRNWCNPATWLNQTRWGDQPDLLQTNGHGDGKLSAADKFWLGTHLAVEERARRREEARRQGEGRSDHIDDAPLLDG